ncbi:MAG: hypothetical protein M3483_01540 [Gemmatimonadota bacterium]|nr:hypothetical protein [Gemmatimonadota bacterium]
MTGTSRLGLLIFVAILVILHFVLRVGLGLGFLVPDLILVALLLAARHMRAGWAAGLGLLLGVLEGAVIPFAFGASALALTILGFAGARSRELFAGYSPVLLALYLFAGKWAYDILVYVIVMANSRPGPISTLYLVSPLSAVYAAAAGLAVYSAYRTFS